MSRLLHISTEKRIPIYLQIVDSITDAIRRGNYRKGDRIFSINEMSNEYFLARDTVQKAYNILQRQGVITPVKGKGFYVENDHPQVAIKVLLLFSKISNYKKQIYNSFVNTIGPDAVVDIKIHHFSSRIFSDLVANNLSDYDYFVVMPHFTDAAGEAMQAIRSIPPDQLIVLDKNLYPDIDCGGAVYQDFQNDIIDALEQGIDLLRKYNKLLLVYPKVHAYSPGILHGFKKFCMQNDFRSEVLSEFSDSSPLNAKEAYIVIEENDLCHLIRKAKEKSLRIGEDVGIISYNDSPLKEILLDGITVISTDHQKMGESAARLILENSTEKIKNPFVLTRRRSL